jgi:hypothetical protein
MIREPALSEVRQAIREAVAELGDTEHLRSYLIGHAAFARLGIDPRKVQTSADWERLSKIERQAKRELEAMVAEGAVVKIGKGVESELGTDYSYARYYIPSGYQHALARARKNSAEEAVLKERQVHVLTMLRDMEFWSARAYDGVSFNLRRGVTLSLGDWERLLEERR